MDSVSKRKRSEIMGRVKAKGNKSTELRLRGLLSSHRLSGWKSNLPTICGVPDVSFPKKRLAVFVDGCFWHGCPTCYRRPKSKKPFWDRKLLENKARDKKVNTTLRRNGWNILRFYECTLKNDSILVINKIKAALKNPRPLNPNPRIPTARKNGRILPPEVLAAGFMAHHP